MTAPSEQALLLHRAHSLPLAEHRDQAMQLLAPEAPDWDELAAVFVRDPVLLHAILEAAPLPAWLRLATTLRDEASQRLQTLGAALLRGWLLRLPQALAADDGTPGAGGDTLLVAECALHLAHETRYAYPDEAYLAGLWHRLGAGTVERCGLAGPLADAVAFEPALAESYLGAHPLLRLLHVARGLARPGWEDGLTAIAPLCGLSRETLMSLRTDVAFIVRQAAPQADAGQRAIAIRPATAPAAYGSGFDALLDVALSALVQSAFRDLEPPRIAERLTMALRLFCAQDAVIVLVADEHGLLAPLPLGAGAALAGAYDELHQRLEDETSVVALAARSGTPTSYFLHGAPAARSAHDWQLARWLGREGFVCLPLPLGDVVGTAVLPADEHRPIPPAARRASIELIASAARALLDIRAREKLAAEAEARVAARHLDHARRVAHEARNPLTVIKSYLSMIAHRQGTDELANEMEALNGELDRIDALLQHAAEAPASAPEPTSCAVPELLVDLRTLYGESLFASRGIQFELRAAAGLPAAAIPPSALRQMLLNLFRNASEALQPGGRFSVTVPGQVLSNGVPCLEIRLIDNGPGLPADRLADLFSPRPSAKGGGHGGLGLSIVRELVQQWNGCILCRSQAGSGTSFQLLLPLDKYH